MRKKKQTTKLSLIDWCDQQVADGHDLKLHWEGGGDSGWCYFTIDGENSENEYTDKLVDWMYDHLDYGSWAGEFTANGEAIYDTEQKAFVGTDYYHEERNMEFEVNVPISIPKHLWFNQLSIHIEVSGDDRAHVEVGFGISNGFLTNEHRQLETEISKNLAEDIVPDIIKDFEGQTGEEFNNIWDDITLEYSDFRAVGNDIVGEITSVRVSYNEEEDKDIYLDLKQTIVENEN